MQQFNDITFVQICISKLKKEFETCLLAGTKLLIFPFIKGIFKYTRTMYNVYTLMKSPNALGLHHPSEAFIDFSNICLLNAKYLYNI